MTTAFSQNTVLPDRRGSSSQKGYSMSNPAKVRQTPRQLNEVVADTRWSNNLRIDQAYFIKSSKIVHLLWQHREAEWLLRPGAASAGEITLSTESMCCTRGAMFPKLWYCEFSLPSWHASRSSCKTCMHNTSALYFTVPSQIHSAQWHKDPYLAIFSSRCYNIKPWTSTWFSAWLIWHQTNGCLSKNMPHAKLNCVFMEIALNLASNLNR